MSLIEFPMNILICESSKRNVFETHPPTHTYTHRAIQMPIYAQVNATIVFIQNTLQLIKHTSSVDAQKTSGNREI